MFSLLITIIAIALVAALALATLYYGGSVFNQGAERAQAAKISVQAQQILGAMALYRAETGAYPNTLNDLVSTNYLKSIPVAQAETNVALANALAATGTWSMATPGQPVIVLAPVDATTCRAFNYVKFGLDGIFKSLHSGNLEQCVGTDVGNLMIVTAQSATDLKFAAADPAAVVSIGPVVDSANPSAGSTDSSIDGWLVAPGANPSVPAVPVVKFMDEYFNPLTQVSFVAAEIGVPAYSQTIKVQNAGSDPLTLASNTVDAPFSIVSSTCDNAALAAGDVCSITLTFTPPGAAFYFGSQYGLHIQAQGVPASTLPLTGIGGTPTPAFTLLTDGNPAAAYVFNGQDVPTALESTWVTMGTLHPMLNAVSPAYGQYDPIMGSFWGEGDVLPLDPVITFTLTNNSPYPLTKQEGRRNLMQGVSTTCTAVLAPGASCTTMARLTGMYYSYADFGYTAPNGDLTIAKAAISYQTN
jgi:hypothetical protein